MSEKQKAKTTSELECLEAYCHEPVVAFDTVHPRLYCAKHLRESVLADLKYHYNLHYEFIRESDLEP